MTPKLIIFDCDGVLVDSEPITNRLLAEDLTRRGLPMTTEACIDAFVGGTMDQVFRRARSLGAVLPDDWVAEFYDIMCAALGQEVEIIPGVADLLDHLDETGIDVCVASNGPMRKMEVTLGRTGLWDRLRGRIFSAHEVGVAKPDPGLFLHAAETCGASRATSLVIEDSASGARAAKAAGMRCLGFCRDTPAARLTAEAAEPFDDMMDVAELIGIGTRA